MERSGRVSRWSQIQRRGLALATCVAVLATTAAAVGVSAPVVVEAASDPLTLQPLVPDRVLDTRDGTGAPVGKLGAEAELSLTVIGVGGVPESGVGAVVLNVTATEPTAASFLTVYPKGETRPFASSLNFLPGQSVPNLVIAKVGADGAVNFFNQFGETHVVADVMGYLPDGAGYTGLNPARVLDTREGTGAPAGKLGVEAELSLTVAGAGGVPDAGAGAVVLNVTITEPTAASFLTVYPKGGERPFTSSLNYVPGQTVPNLVIAKVGDDGAVNLFNQFGETHVVADVMGYFPADGELVSINPDRVADTRVDGGVSAPLGPDGVLEVDLSDDVPEGTTAIVANVTITEPTAATFITAWPSDADLPFTSNLNAVPGETRPNLVIVRLSADRKVSFYNPFGNSHVIVDLVGWFSEDPGLPPLTLKVSADITPSPATFSGSPLAAVSGYGITSDFVSNELILLGDLADAQAVAAAWAGNIVSTDPASGPIAARHTIVFDLDAIDPPPFIESMRRVDDGIGGDYLVSDAAGLVLLSLVAHLVAEGYSIGINPLSNFATDTTFQGTAEADQ
jgi:hypothetical protein